MSANEKTPLLQNEANSFEAHDASSHNGARSFGHVGKDSSSLSSGSGPKAGSLISYHDICYKITTKVNGVKTEKEIIKHLR